MFINVSVIQVWYKNKVEYKPVLLPGVVSPCVCLSNFSGQHSYDVYEQDEVELEQKNRYGKLLLLVIIVDL